MGASDTLDIFDGYNAGNVVFKVQLQEPSAGTYKVRAGMLDNGTTWTYTNWYGVTANAWNAVEISYQALANDGAMTLWLNGNSQQSLSRIDNSARALTACPLSFAGSAPGRAGSGHDYSIPFGDARHAVFRQPFAFGSGQASNPGGSPISGRCLRPTCLSRGCGTTKCAVWRISEDQPKD